MEETKDKLLRIMETYNIGKKPLSRLLGWGETTIINQLKGNGISPEFARKIDEIWENPTEFESVLETNKDRLTPVAYKKAREALNKSLMRNKTGFMVMYLCKKAGYDIAPYAVTAVLFYAQAANLMTRGMPLFDDDVVYKKGNIMPYPDVYAELVKKGTTQAFTRMNTELLRQEEKEMLDSTFKLISGYSPNAVKKLLKMDRAGLLAMQRNVQESTEGFMISLSELQLYFAKEVLEKGFTDVKDFKPYFEIKLKKKQ